jgi:hypothetical protein
MGKVFELADWHIEAANLMARTGCSLKEAATILAAPVTTEDIQVLLRRQSFQRILWEARYRFFKEIGSDPQLSKETAIGKLVSLAQKLEEEGSHDKAAEAWFKVIKTAGWVGPENQISVFGELTQKDLESIRKKVEGDMKSVRPN